MRGDIVGFFEKIFSNYKTIRPSRFFKTLNAYQPAFTSWSGRIYESELVRAAISTAAAHASKMNVTFTGSARPELRTHLKAAPNEFQTWSQFLARTMTILEVNNTAFIVPMLDKFGTITGIYTVVPSRCELVEWQGVPYLRYKFATGQSAAVELALCGVMLKHQYKDDFKGESNSALDQTMALIDIQNQGIKEGVKNAASYRLLAVMNNFAKAEDIEKERKRFTAANFSRDSEGGGLLLLPNTYTNVQQMHNTPFVVNAAQMQLIQTNVYNYFGVNEAILQNKATADQMDAFYNGKLEPFAIQLSEVLAKMFYTVRERNNGNAVYVASDRLQYMNIASKVSMATQLGDRGMITINEVRALFNYAPIADGDRAPIRGEYYFTGEEKPNADNE